MVRAKKKRKFEVKKENLENTKNNKKTFKISEKQERIVAVFLAIRSLLHNKKMLIMVFFIIGLGYLSMIFSSSIIVGLQNTIDEKAILSLTGNILIEHKDNKMYINNLGSLEKTLDQLPNVISYSPHLKKGFTLIDKNGNKISAQVIIIDPKKEYSTTDLNKFIIEGKPLSSADLDPPEILVGSELTNYYAKYKDMPTLDIRSGDILKAIIGGDKKINVKVKGIYTYGFAGSDIYVYMNKETAKKVFNLSDEELNKATQVLVRTEKTGDEANVMKKILGVGLSADIYNWKDRLGVIKQFTDSLMIISNLTSVIGLIIAFVTVYIVIIINVFQKRSQIGILKAIGITEKTILNSYILQGFVYGLFGALFGFVITYLLNFYLSYHPLMMPMGAVYPYIPFKSYIITGIILIVASTIASYFASKGVIKENILDAIFNS